MRHLFYISIFVSVYIIAACSGHSFRRSLLVADSMSSVDPKSAVSLLDSIRGEMSSAPKHERMYYRLLCIKAADKAYMPHKSDTAILPLIEYYEKHGDKKLLAETYYYAGSIYRDMNDAPMALDYFQKALDVMPEDTDWGLKSNICYQMGDLFLHQYFYDEAINMYFEAYHYDSISKDIAAAVSCLESLGYTYNKKKQKDSSIIYYNKAYSQARKNHNKKLEKSVLGQMTSFYIENKEYDKAKKCLFPLLYSDTINIMTRYAMASDIYMDTEQYDSAKYYCNILIEKGSAYAKQNANRKLIKIYFKEGRYDDMIKSLSLYEQYRDSVNNITATESVVRMNAIYNYQIREKENLKLRIENSHRLVVIVLISVFCGVCILLFIFYSKRAIQKRSRLELQIQILKRMEKERNEHSSEYIKENNKKISLLEERLSTANHKTEELMTQLMEQKADLLFANEKAEREIKKRNLREERLLNSDAYKITRLKLEQRKNITKKEWDEIDICVNDIVEDFKTRLYSLYPMSDQEYRMCLLIRLGFGITEIASLLNRSKGAMSLARKRLYIKMFGKDGYAVDIDEFVKSL